VIARWVLRIVWFLILMAGILIVGLFPLAETGDLPTAVLADQLTSHFGTPKVWMLIGGLLIALSVLLRRRLRRLIQLKSDGTASRIMDELAAGAETPDLCYLVYLRAFETTGKLKAPWFMFANDLGLQRLRSTEQESYLAWAVRKLGPLVALGEPGEHLGAGRIKTTDADWQQAVKALVGKAKAVLIIPSDRPGTLWEVQYLRSEGLLPKTVFIMPPEARGFDWRARWNDARKALGDFGAALPEYDRHGLMFRLDAEGQVLDINHLPVWRPHRFRKAVQRFLSGKPKAGDGASRVSKAVRAARRHWLFGYLSGLFRVAATGAFLFLLAVAEPMLRPSGTTEPWSTLGDRYSAAIERQHLGEQITNRLWLNSDYQRLATDLDPRQEETLRGELTWRGLAWVPSRHLRAYFAGLAGAYSRLSPDECRRLVDGELGLSDLNHAWVRTDPDVVRDFSSATIAALEAGVTNGAPPAVEDAHLIQASRAFLDGLTPDERTRFSELESSPANAVADADLCWLLVTTYNGFSRVDEALALPLFRVIDRDALSISKAASAADPGADPGLSESPLRHLLESPEYQARIAGLDEDARVSLLIELMNAGLPRLDDEALLTYYAIFGRVLATLELDACADIAAGNLAFDNTPPFEALPESVQQAYENLLYTAARLAAEERPVPALEDDAVESVAAIFIASLEDAEVARMERMQTEDDSVSNDDVCWFLRKKIDAGETLEMPHRAVWARALILGHF
jgi:hypothetical protein